MVKIAVVTPMQEAYSETFIRAHIEYLPAEVHVLSGGQRPTLADGEPLVRDYSLPQRVRFMVRQRLRGEPWNWEAKQAAAIEEWLQRLQIRAVLAEYGPTGVAMMDACERTGIPLVVHFHGYDAFREDVVAEYQGDYQKLFAKCAALIANTNSMKNRLMGLGAPVHLILRNPVGVDTEKFTPTSPEANPPLFLAVGRFVNKKAPYLTLMAFHQACQRAPGLQLTMVGDGPLWEACVRLSDLLGISDRVDFLGIRTSSEIVELMGSARGFVQHSLTSFDGDSESLGVVFLEAGASGLPVVATRHDGIPEVVVEGETGILVDEGDVEGMAEAMVLLASDPTLAAKMGKAGRWRVVEHFSMEQSISSLWRIIEAAMEGSTHGNAKR
jgi:colanic acid/amylovoran biosynthesis glycosyltransferase